jgi:hypothetical protein
MKIIEWENEVNRVAKVLGLNEKDRRDFYMWTVHMAYDELAKAQARLSGELEIPVLAEAFNSLDERLWEAFGDLADQVVEAQ